MCLEKGEMLSNFSFSFFLKNIQNIIFILTSSKNYMSAHKKIYILATSSKFLHLGNFFLLEKKNEILLRFFFILSTASQMKKCTLPLDFFLTCSVWYSKRVMWNDVTILSVTMRNLCFLTGNEHYKETFLFLLMVFSNNSWLMFLVHFLAKKSLVVFTNKC